MVFVLFFFFTFSIIGWLNPRSQNPEVCVCKYVLSLCVWGIIILVKNLLCLNYVHLHIICVYIAYIFELCMKALD